jgi:GTPase SAR1 family protein
MSDSDDDEMLQYKIILLGDGTVGKTSIAMRFTNDTFGQSYKQVALLTARWRAQGAHSAAAAVLHSRHQARPVPDAPVRGARRCSLSGSGRGRARALG